MGIGIGEFGAKAEEREIQRRASEVDSSLSLSLGVHDEEGEEGEGSDADTIRKGRMPGNGNGNGRRGSGMKVDVSGREREALTRQTSEEERREMRRPVAGTPGVEEEDPLSRVPVLVSL